MIYIVVYSMHRTSYVVAAFYDEKLAMDFAAKQGKGYTVECFIGAKKLW